MYTEEDIINLAEFLYLAAAQINWTTFGEPQSSYKELGFIAQNNWKELARIALDFTESKKLGKNTIIEN